MLTALTPEQIEELRDAIRAVGLRGGKDDLPILVAGELHLRGREDLAQRVQFWTRWQLAEFE